MNISKSKQQIMEEFDKNNYEGLYSVNESDGELFDQFDNVRNFLSEALDSFEKEIREEYRDELSG